MLRHGLVLFFLIVALLAKDEFPLSSYGDVCNIVRKSHSAVYSSFAHSQPSSKPFLIIATQPDTGAHDIHLALQSLGYRGLYLHHLLNDTLPEDLHYFESGHPFLNRRDEEDGHDEKLIESLDYLFHKYDYVAGSIVPELAPYLLRRFPEAKVVLSWRNFSEWEEERMHEDERASFPFAPLLLHPKNRAWPLSYRVSTANWQLYASQYLLLSCLAPTYLLLDYQQHELCNESNGRWHMFISNITELMTPPRSGDSIVQRHKFPACVTTRRHATLSVSNSSKVWPRQEVPNLIEFIRSSWTQVYKLSAPQLSKYFIAGGSEGTTGTRTLTKLLIDMGLSGYHYTKKLSNTSPLRTFVLNPEDEFYFARNGTHHRFLQQVFFEYLKKDFLLDTPAASIAPYLLYATRPHGKVLLSWRDFETWDRRREASHAASGVPFSRIIDSECIGKRCTNKALNLKNMRLTATWQLYAAQALLVTALSKEVMIMDLFDGSVCEDGGRRGSAMLESIVNRDRHHNPPLPVFPRCASAEAPDMPPRSASRPKRSGSH